jgi:hypothetical protein
MRATFWASLAAARKARPTPAAKSSDLLFLRLTFMSVHRAEIPSIADDATTEFVTVFPSPRNYADTEARVARDTIVSVKGKPQVPLSDRV